MSWLTIIKSTLPGLATKWLQGREKRKDQEHEQEIEEIKAGLRDNDRLLRRGSFILLSIPFIWGYHDPEGVRAYFQVIQEAMPQWYVEAYMVILFGIWGISTGKNVVVGIIKAFRKK